MANVFSLNKHSSPWNQGHTVIKLGTKHIYLGYLYQQALKCHFSYINVYLTSGHNGKGGSLGREGHL